MSGRNLLAVLLIVAALAGCGREAVHKDKTVSEWVEKLEGKNYYARIEAAEALGAIGPAAKQGVPALIRAFKDWEAERAEKKRQPLYTVPGIGVTSADPPSLRKAAGEALKKIGKPAVPALVKELQDANIGVRLEVTRLLGEMGADAGAAVPAIADLLAAESQRERSAAAKALGGIPGERAAVQALTGALKDSNLAVRSDACRALGNHGAEAASAVPALRELLTAGSSKTDRTRAAETLALIGPAASAAVPDLITATADSKTDQRAPVNALAMIGEPAIPELVKALAHSDRRIRRQAAVALGKMGPKAQAAVPALIRALPDSGIPAREQLALIGKPAVPALPEQIRREDATARRTAIEVLAAIGPAAQDAARELLTVLATRPEKEDQCAALNAIGRIAADSPEVLALLKARLDHKERAVRHAAAEALGREHWAMDAVAPILIEGLAEKDSTVDSELINALARRGAAAVPYLQKALAHSSATVRARSVYGLMLIGPPAAERAVPALVDALRRDPDSEVRSESARALANFASAPDRIVPALAEALGDKDDRVRAHGSATLAKVGEPAVPALLKALEHPLPKARVWAARALGKIGAPARGAVPGIAKILKQTDRDARLAAVQALDQLDPQCRACLPDLVAALGDPDMLVRDAVVTLAAKAGKDAVPRLRAALRDPNAGIRCGAASALGKIGPDAAAGAGDLVKALDDSDRHARRAAVEALGRMPVALVPYVPKLAAVLKHQDDSVAREVARVLGRIGPAARAAAPALQEAARSGSPIVKRAAEDALKAIER
ncbi:MAG: HEAT repeat domain-containing protein [Kiritimatiellae bacterium]|nr:HEAT repeat domain-containing protein [Kiritimatiellia bacterium]